MGNEIKTKAIVTKTVPYHEADMLVTLVSPDKGRITAVARGCLKPKAKLRYASEILNFGDYMLSEKSGRYVITECSQIEPFIKITYDIGRFYGAALILDALQKVSQEPNPKAFVSALESLNRLAHEEETADVIRDFLLGILSTNGLNLDFSHCNVCGCDIEGDCFYKEADGIVCRDCRGQNGYLIDATSVKFFRGQDVPLEMKKRADMLLSDIIRDSLGIKIDTQYFTEIL
ncbi:MAG: DNA repair protein RecO [Clostridia bacterium]|nr:DNA repair protein RecO [Clostridia bacterium]